VGGRYEGEGKWGEAAWGGTAGGRYEGERRDEHGREGGGRGKKVEGRMGAEGGGWGREAGGEVACEEERVGGRREGAFLKEKDFLSSLEKENNAPIACMHAFCRTGCRNPQKFYQYPRALQAEVHTLGVHPWNWLFLGC